MNKGSWFENNTLIRESFGTKVRFIEKAGGGLTFDQLLLIGSGGTHQYNKILYPECTGDNFTKFFEDPSSIQEKFIPNTAANRRKLFASNPGGEGNRKRVAANDKIYHKTDSSGLIQHHSFGRENAPGLVHNLFLQDHTSNHSYYNKKILSELKSELEKISALDGALTIYDEYVKHIKSLTFSDIEDTSYSSLFNRDPSPLELDAFAMIEMTNYIKKNIQLRGFEICCKQWQSEDTVHKEIFNFKDLQFLAATDSDVDSLDYSLFKKLIGGTSIITADKELSEGEIENPYKVALPVKIIFSKPLSSVSNLLNISGILGAKIDDYSALICFKEIKDSIINPNVKDDLLQKTVTEFKRRTGMKTIVVRQY